MRPILKVHPHYVSIWRPDHRLLALLYQIAREYTRFAMVFDVQKKKRVYKPDKTFALYIGKGSEYRIHTGQWHFIEREFRNGNLDLRNYDVRYIPGFPGDDVILPMKPGWALREEQAKAQDFVLSSPPAERFPLLSMPTGSGKAQPLDTPVRVPGGWKPMRDIHLWDTVIAWDGFPTLVTGEYPQPRQQVYRITFGDGRWTECCLAHLWKVHALDNSFPSDVLSLGELITRLDDPRYQGKLAIDLPKMEDGLEYLYPITSYLLGTMQADVDQTNISPSSYERMGVASRWARVQGMMDQRGQLDPVTGELLFPTESLSLAEALQYLVRSLGGYAKITTSRVPDEETLSYTVTIRHRTPSQLFRSIAKQLAVQANAACTSVGLLEIVSITASRETEVKCISIAHQDKLYVTQDFIVTHNTVTSLVTASKISKRLAIFVLSKYVPKWEADVKSVYDLQPEEICLVEGGKDLINASHWVSGGSVTTHPLPKVFIISINTFHVWIKKYIEDPNDPCLDEYGCTLDEFLNTLGVGTIIFDEIHEHFHIVYKLICFLPTEWAIALSATLISKDEMVSKIQNMMFPRHIRFEEVKMKRYIKAFACPYQIQGFHQQKIQYMEYGTNRYSHNKYEDSLFKHRTLGNRYVRMIVDLVESTYHRHYLQGDKCIVYVGKIKTANAICGALKARFKEKYDIRTYVESDPYENVIDSDIRVSTPQSAGTAVDIPNLRVAIMTISVDSPTSNLQMLGRLRELKDRDVKFYYLYTTSIPKQVEYHHNKKQLFASRTAFIHDYPLDPLIP
jgi:superfamily II DNA or RNA helicase